MGPRSHNAKGVLLMVGSAMAFCIMASLIKYASFLDPYKTTLFRFVVGLAILSTAALFGKVDLRCVNGPLLFLRGLCGGAGVFFFFLSIGKLGVAKGTVMSYSFPIFASIFSALFLKEKIPKKKLAAVAGAFAGIYFLASERSPGLHPFAAFGKYEALAILGAVLSGIAIVAVKRLHDTDSTFAIYLAQCAIGLWLVILPANAIPCAIGYRGGVFLVAIGVFATTAQLLMIEAYRHLSVTTGSLLVMLVPVLNFLAGALIFHETLSGRAVAGSALVVGSCIAVLINRYHATLRKCEDVRN